MKRLLLIPLLVILAACVPVVVDVAVVQEPAQAPWTHVFRVDTAGVFVAASSARILAVDGPGCQLRATAIGGVDSAVSCNAPGRFKIQTAGSVSAGLVR